jgi:hypothetical protein
MRIPFAKSAPLTAADGSQGRVSAGRLSFNGNLTRK